MASWFSPAYENRFRVSTPYSSTVCSRAVVNRQFAINSSPRNTPSTVFVFPTSIVPRPKRGLFPPFERPFALRYKRQAGVTGPGLVPGDQHGHLTRPERRGRT